MKKLLLGLIISLILFSTAPAAHALASFDWEFDQHIHIVDILDDGKTVNEVSDSWINLWGDFDLRTVSSKWTNICWLIQEQDAQNICIRDLNFDGNIEINQILRNSSGTYVWFKWGQHPWQGIIRKGDRLKIQFNYETFSLSTKLGAAWKTLISKGIASMTTYGLTGGSCKNVKFSFLLPKYAKMVTANSEGLTPSFSSLDERVVVEFSFSDGMPKDHAPYEVVYTYAKPVLTARLDLTPIPAVYYEGDVLTYYVGDTLTGKFSIKNAGSLPITLDVLTVGGRLNGECPPEGCPDFTFRTVTLQPGEPPTQYEGSLTFTKPGEYHFFVAYYIENPTPEEKLLLDENNWNTNIDLGEGLEDEDRIEDIIVLERPPISRACIDRYLLDLIDRYSSNYYKEEWKWELTKDQYKAWIATIAWSEGGRGGYTAHSRWAPGGDIFYHKVVGKEKFNFSTGIGPFQLDLHGSDWPTIKKLNLFEALSDTMGFFSYPKFGIGSTLADFSARSDWLAVKPGYVDLKWKEVTDTNWNGEKDTDLKWGDIVDRVKVEDDPNFSYNHNVRYLGQMKWDVEFTTKARPDDPVVFNKFCHTWLITARTDVGTATFRYYYTYDDSVKCEVWVWDNGGEENEYEYIFVRDYAKNDPPFSGRFPEHIMGVFAGETKLDRPALSHEERVPRSDIMIDNKVDILDIFIVANAFGSKLGDANWNVIADLNKDGAVNILDVFAVAWDFGKTSSQ